MNYENTQRVIPLINTINKEEVKMNHHGARGYRFEMEVLGAFYASPSYVLNENLRLLTGDRGYCDGVIHSGYMNGNTFVKQLKVCEIEVKLRNGVGKEPRAALIDALLESKTFNFLSHNLHLNHGNPRRIFVLGLTTDLETQRSQGVCSYDQYGEIVVVYFHKQWSQFEEYERRQAIRFYPSFHEFNNDLYQSIDLDDYFDRLIGDQSVQPYFDLINKGEIDELIFQILPRLTDFTATQQLAFIQLLRHQSKVGYRTPLKGLCNILGQQNASAHIVPFVEIGWVEKESKQYKINLVKIIDDLFKESHNVDVQGILKAAGFDLDDLL
jgi:hypothetical protein